MKIDNGIAISEITVVRSVAQEREHDHRDEAGRRRRACPCSVPDRGLDEVGLAEGDLRCVDAGRQRPASSRRAPLSIARVSPHRVGRGLLLHAQDHRGPAVEAPHRRAGSRREAHLGDLRQQDRLAVWRHRGHRHLGRSSRLEVRPEVAYQVLAAVEREEAARGVGREALERASRPARARRAARPCARVSGWTWNWRTSPPIGITCATPGIASRRGRSTQSAYSRTAIGVVFASSIGSATSMTSPMIELIGPIFGTTPCGSALSSDESRSADELPGAVDRRCPSRRSRRRTTVRQRTRSAPLSTPGQAVHRGLEREADELLDLLGRHAAGLGHERDRRLVQVREHVHRRARPRARAVRQQHQAIASTSTGCEGSRRGST